MLSFLLISFPLGVLAQSSYPPPIHHPPQPGIDHGYQGEEPTCYRSSHDDNCPRIKWITFGTNTSYYTDLGDTFYSSWGPDWNVWFSADDTTGMRGACLPNGSNIAINKATGLRVSDLQTTTVNCMKEWGEHGADSGHHDGGSWKNTGLSWIDDVLYVWISRNVGPTHSNYENRQSAQNSCLLKSTDYGRTFQGKNNSQCFTTPMFPGRLFGTPSFIEYGRNGEAGPHESGTYAYAVSNDGSWENGSSMRLGRVRRDRLGDLDANAWEFYRQSGCSKSPSWTSNIDQATPILSNPYMLSSSSAIYNPYLDEYIIAQWYFPNRTGFGVYIKQLYPTVFSFYAARKPWGPYRLVSNTTWPDAAWYNPSIVSKFAGFDGKSGILFTSGHGYGGDYGSAYTFSTMPFKIEVFE